MIQSDIAYIKGRKLMLKRFCLYIAIPFIIALLFRLFRLAQGEKLEEIVSGILV